MSNEDNPNTEKLLDAANSASQTAAALQIGFLSFIAYVGVIVWGTSHEDFLLDRPLKLPVLYVDVPILDFFRFVPWMLVVLHGNLLLQLHMLAVKLQKLDLALSKAANCDEIRNRLVTFPFSQLLAGNTDKFQTRIVMAFVVGLTFIALPLLMLLMAQISFIPYHDERTTWIQRGAVWFDGAMLISLWPSAVAPHQSLFVWIKTNVCQLGSGIISVAERLLSVWTKASIDSHNIGGLPSRTAFLDKPQGFISLAASLIVALPSSCALVVPGNTVINYDLKTTMIDPDSDSAHFEDTLIRLAPPILLSMRIYDYSQNGEDFAAECEPLSYQPRIYTAYARVMLGPCWMHTERFSKRDLSLKDANLLPKGASLALLTRATDKDPVIRKQALQELDGLNLRGRDLRFADLRNAALPKANLRNAKLQGATLHGAKLQGAEAWDGTKLYSALLGGAQMQGVGLGSADLHGADLRGAVLDGANLSHANLNGADLRGADLTEATLIDTHFNGADLRGAKMTKAKLEKATFKGSSLDMVDFSSAILMATDFSYAILYRTSIEDVEMRNACLGGASIVGDANRPGIDRLLHLNGVYALRVGGEHTDNDGKQMQTSLARKSEDAFSGEACPMDSERTFYWDVNAAINMNFYTNRVLYPQIRHRACNNPRSEGIGTIRRLVNEDKKGMASHPLCSFAKYLVENKDEKNCSIIHDFDGVLTDATQKWDSACRTNTSAQK